MAELARAAVARGVRRIVVAGGETSGAVVDGLGIDRVVVARFGHADLLVRAAEIS
jgi:uncharacterized protein YgbK (DUF1537 family)